MTIIVTMPKERAGAVFVASPLGFTEPGRIFFRDRLLPRLHSEGFHTSETWSHHASTASFVGAEPKSAVDNRLPDVRNRHVAQASVKEIERAAMVLAVLDGTDVDSGTAAEIGFAYRCGKPIIGWRSDLRQAGENEAAPINLQVAYFIEASGGCIVTTLNEAVDALALLQGRPAAAGRTELSRA